MRYIAVAIAIVATVAVRGVDSFRLRASLTQDNLLWARQVASAVGSGFHQNSPDRQER